MGQLGSVPCPQIGSYPKSPPLINGQRDLASWKIKVVVSVVGKDPSIVAKWADVVKGKVEGWSVTLEETKVLE